MANIWLKMTEITGESSDLGHEGEIDIVSWRWRFSRTSRNKTGKNTQVHHMSFVHKTDLSSIGLLNHMFTNRVAEEALLSSRSPTAQATPGGVGKLLPPFDFSKIRLKKVMVMDIEPFGNSIGHFEEVILSFAEFKWEYSPENSGFAMGTATAQYNLGPDVA